MKIIKGRPPNFEKIVTVLPGAASAGVFFAYGDSIYTQDGIEPSHHIKVHEATHAIRQKEIGIDFWWDRYLTDIAFRYYEELLAHTAEYRAMIKSAINGKQKRFILKSVSQRLANKLYGFNIRWMKARDDILNQMSGEKG